MSKPVAIHIVGNTSSSTEAFARRTNEISRFVSGLGRQNNELVRNLRENMRLTLIRTHPVDKGMRMDGRIIRHVLPLAETIKTKNPNNVYRKSTTLKDLFLHFEPLVEKMAEIVKDADVVLLGGTYFVPWCLLQAARRHRKPVVLCYAGILSMEITHLPPEIQAPLKLMEKDFYDPNIFYVFPSNLTKHTVEGIFGQELPNSEVVFNGVPLEFLGVKGAEKTVPVAFVGRNTPVKNPEFLLRLSRRLRRKIHMVTKADEKNKLVQDLRKAGVVVLKPMNTNELARFYSRTNVVVSPSHFETYGNVPLEAVSTGTPALISSSMGVSEVFNAFGIGRYVTNFSDTHSVAQRIESIIQREDRIHDKVRARIRKELSWPKIIQRYLEICLSTL